MIKIKILLTGSFLMLVTPQVTVAQKKIEQTRVNVHIIEENSQQITSAMVCITGAADGKVRLPPFGLITDSTSRTKTFYTGIDYKKDKNWIGPVRKTNGLSDNDNRSSLYGLLPSLPYWREPVMYQTSGDFTVD